MAVPLIVAVIIFCTDFLIKTHLRLHYPHESIPLIKNVLHVSVVFNTGAAFGILQEKTTLLNNIGVIFLLTFFFQIRSEKRTDKFFLVACGLIFGGALSNLYDRITLGFVVDYIDIRIWPVFNLSDSCISIGIGMLIWQSLRRKHPKPSQDSEGAA